MKQVWWLLQLQVLVLRELWLGFLGRTCNPLSPFFGELILKLRDLRERKVEIWQRFN